MCVCVSGNPWNSGLLLHGPTERWDNVDYWDFPRHVRPLAFPPCSLFAYTWKTLEAIASSDFYLDCLPDVEGLNRRPDLSIMIHWRRPTGTIPPFFFCMADSFHVRLCAGILGFGYCGRCCCRLESFLLLPATFDFIKFLSLKKKTTGTIVQDRV